MRRTGDTGIEQVSALRAFRSDDIASVGRPAVAPPRRRRPHVGHILAKLGLRDRVQAVVLAYESGMVQPADD